MMRQPYTAAAETKGERDGWRGKEGVAKDGCHEDARGIANARTRRDDESGETRAGMAKKKEDEKKSDILYNRCDAAGGFGDAGGRV